MIEDEELGTLFAYINWPEEPCRQRRYNGQLYYYMRCLKTPYIKYVPPAEVKELDDIYIQVTRENFLEPIQPPATLGNLPEDLWEAIYRVLDLVPIALELPPPEWFVSMMKWVAIALCVGALIFVVAIGKK